MSYFHSQCWWKRQQLVLARTMLACARSNQRQKAYRYNHISSSSSLAASAVNSSTQVSDSIELKKVLIANRGEIACRINRTCAKWDIPTVAIYSIADSSSSFHAQTASESYLIGTGPAVSDSYLRQDDIIELALRTGCDSIHPGYGFLSENSVFASKCESVGLKFIGPTSRAIEMMGNKSKSKAIMDAAGVPTTPGYYETSSNLIAQDVDVLYNKALEIGFPLLIKAVAGGGGKGMRIVWNSNDFLPLLESCQRESINSFGNDHVLLEKYLLKPRHIEIQVISDKAGNTIHLYERDCSVQRRHQKIFEEAPASIDIHPILRQKLGEKGVLAAKAVQYENAGTVEFLLDTSPQYVGSMDQPFYFCEMNTRLQVEHPVTELITGIDLVEWQLRVAAGQSLPITQQNMIPCSGHAIEARIYAEKYSPETNTFLPATGTLWHHQYNVTPLSPSVNASSTTVRVDTGLRQTTTSASSVGEKEQQISVYYDPMISKLIVHGPNRKVAVQLLKKALHQYHIAGVPTNIPFLIRCVQHPIFKLGGQHVTTGFLDDYGHEVIHPPSSGTTAGTDDKVQNDITSNPLTPAIIGQAAGSLAVMLHIEKRIIRTSFNEGRSSQSKLPWSSDWGSWRMADAKPKLVIRSLQVDKEENITIWKLNDGSFDIQLPNSTCAKIINVKGWLNDATNEMKMIIDNSHTIRLNIVLRTDTDRMTGSSIVRVRMWPNGNVIVGSLSPYSLELDVENPTIVPFYQRNLLDQSSNGSSAGIGGYIKSPMPGKVTRINYKVGDIVSPGDVVLVMEAMKMEHPLVAKCMGTIQEIRYQVNDVVTKDGAVVCVIVPSSNE